MYNEINKLTSVENEYLEKSGKKRRQKNRSFYLISNENDNKYFTQIVDNSIFSNERDNAVKNSNQNNIESDYKKDVQEHDEDLSTLEVIRQLSSIKIDSSTDSSNAKDSYARNRIREKKKEKKNEKKKKIIIHHIPSIECVEDIVVYDESSK